MSPFINLLVITVHVLLCYAIKLRSSGLFRQVITIVENSPTHQQYRLNISHLNFSFLPKPIANSVFFQAPFPLFRNKC